MKFIGCIAWFICICYFSDVQSQSLCQKYSRVKISLDSLIRVNSSERDRVRGRNQIDLYVKKSSEASRLLLSCIYANRLKINTSDGYQVYYELGKCLHDAGYCREADSIFWACIDQPVGAIDRKIYDAHKAGCKSLVNRCLKAKAANSDATRHYITYSGKGQFGVKDIFGDYDTQYNFENFFLPSGEIEQMAMRNISLSDSLNEQTFSRLAIKSDYVDEGPFIILNCDSTKDPGKIKQLQKDRVMVKRNYERLKKQYFDSLKHLDNYIPVYLIGDIKDRRDISPYLKFCQERYSHVMKRVGFFSSIDNSIVVWKGSGNGTVIHEMTHALIHADFPDAPEWLDEGLSSLNEEMDKSGHPLDNYKLTLIHEAYDKFRCIIDIKMLLSAENKDSLSDTEHLLLNAYYRYFCKFIHDIYGQSKMSDIYKRIRDSKRQGLDLYILVIQQTLGVYEYKQLQQKWETYLLKQKEPYKWLYCKGSQRQAIQMLTKLNFSCVEYKTVNIMHEKAQVKFAKNQLRSWKKYLKISRRSRERFRLSDLLYRGSPQGQ